MSLRQRWNALPSERQRYIRNFVRGALVTGVIASTVTVGVVLLYIRPWIGGTVLISGTAVFFGWLWAELRRDDPPWMRN